MSALTMRRRGLTRHRGAFAGAPFAVYGHSYTVDPGAACTPGQEFHKLAAAQLGTAIPTTAGVGSTRLTEAVIRAISSGEAPYTPPNAASLVVLDSLVNDAQFSTSSSGPPADEISGFKHSLRAFLAIAGCSRIEDTAFTFNGAGWVTSTGGPGGKTPSGGSFRYNGTSGDTVDFTFTGDTAYVLFFVDSTVAPDAGFITANVDFKVGGSTIASFIGRDQMRAFVSGAAGTPTYSYSYGVAKISGLGGGSHTVRMQRQTGDTIQVLQIDAVLVPVATPPTVLVIKDPPVATSYVSYAKIEANRPALMQAVDEVCSEFSYARAVSIDTSAWNAATMIAADKIHPNDAGMAHIASRLVAVANGPLLSDTFPVDGPPVAAETGQIYTVSTGTGGGPTIVSGKYKPPAGGTYRFISATVPDHTEVYVDWTANDDMGARIVIGTTSLSSDAVYLQVSQTTAQLRTWNGTTETTIASVVFTPTTGQTYRLRVTRSGTRLNCLIDNTTVLSATVATAVGPICGFGDTHPFGAVSLGGNTFDNFTVR